mmetsp:Transcript_33413/g.81489  ORF Transcript_33413/g.81489 Transcript_33413/m.81489 type:complete len:239 (+) Transcript_33413:377-1093(+)
MARQGRRAAAPSRSTLSSSAPMCPSSSSASPPGRRPPSARSCRGGAPAGGGSWVTRCTAQASPSSRLCRLGTGSPAPRTMTARRPGSSAASTACASTAASALSTARMLWTALAPVTYVPTRAGSRSASAAPTFPWRRSRARAAANSHYTSTTRTRRLLRLSQTLCPRRVTSRPITGWWGPLCSSSGGCSRPTAVCQTGSCGSTSVRRLPTASPKRRTLQRTGWTRRFSACSSSMTART